jgi:gliding motility-associated lipoprotein GldD
MVKLRKISLGIILILICTTYSCRKVSVPKPRGHFRIDLPQKQYILFDYNMVKGSALPFTFEYPVYGQLAFNIENGSDPGWFNVEFPAYRAKIYLTYKKVNRNFEGLMDQTYKMNVKNHITKADAINEEVLSYPKNKVYGILYDLKGNTASAVQFYATDSTNNYLRGSLYFSAEPNADSLAPVIDFFRADIVHLIETLRWK